MMMKTENWNGHPIRFIEMAPGDWWALASDVFSVLDIKNTSDAIKRLDEENHTLVSIYSRKSTNPDVNFVNEFGIYDIVFSSRKKEAKEFKRWVFGIIKTLRKTSDLEGYQVFRMLDKEHQKETMLKLRDGLSHPVRVDFIKANTIANKAVSTNHGYLQMIKKDHMTPDMLLERQPILTDTVRLMEANDSFGLGLSVSDAVYKKYCH